MLIFNRSERFKNSHGIFDQYSCLKWSYSGLKNCKATGPFYVGKSKLSLKAILCYCRRLVDLEVYSAKCHSTFRRFDVDVRASNGAFDVGAETFNSESTNRNKTEKSAATWFRLVSKHLDKRSPESFSVPQFWKHVARAERSTHASWSGCWMVRISMVRVWADGCLSKSTKVALWPLT